jgi:uncharacterized membrane protein YccC
MTEGVITTFIVAIAGPILTLAIQQFFTRRKNKADYGDNLLDVVNKTSESLKKAREEIAQMDQTLRQLDQTHEQEITDLQHQHKRERDRLRARLTELEKVLVRYDISFTLTTHPEVRVENLKVIGKDETTSSQKLKAITPQQALEDQEKRKSSK